MGVKRGSTDEPDSKRARVTLEEEVIVNMDDLEEVHVCLLCNGIDRETKREDKGAKAMKFNTCLTRNHYSLCLLKTEEGRIYFEKTYPSPGFVRGGPVKINCNRVQCQNDQRFKNGFTNQMLFHHHIALYHGGLEKWMLSQDRKDLRALVPRLLCHKLPDVCFVPSHYGQ